MSRRPTPFQAAGLTAVILSILYFFLFMGFGFSGWIRWDEGAMGQMAERILYGEYPHTHYDCMYTGLLSMLHAAWQALFGIEMSTLRWFLFATSYVFQAVFFLLTLKLTRRLDLTILLTLLTMLWGALQYPTSMPSYQITYLTFYATACLMLHLRSGQARWVALAGVFCALTILIKITGLYLVMALGYYWIYDNQNRVAKRSGWREKPTWTPLGLVISACLLLPPIMVTKLIASPLTLANWLYYVVPFIALAACVIRREAWLGAATLGQRAVALARVLTPYAIGLALTLAPFLGFYLAIGGIGDLFYGVFVQPFTRLEATSTWAPYFFSPWMLWALVIFGLLILPWMRRWTPVIFALALGVPLLGLIFGGLDQLTEMLWLSLRWLTPLAGLFPVIALFTRANRAAPESSNDARFGDLIITASCLTSVSLLQFPYAVTLYYFYVIPLTALAFVCYSRLLSPTLAKPIKLARGLFIALLIAFAFIKLLEGPKAITGVSVSDVHVPLETPRDGIKVDPSDFIAYYQIGEIIKRVAPEDEYIYAFPDTPHIYFLYGKRNPTRAIFDVIGRTPEDYASDETLQLLDEKNVNVVVMYTYDSFSETPSLEVFKKLSERYPNYATTKYKRYFILWRNPVEAQETAPAQAPQPDSP